MKELCENVSYLPKGAIEQSGHENAHKTGQKTELILHKEWQNLIGFLNIALGVGIAVDVRGIDDHARDPGDGKEEEDQRHIGQHNSAKSDKIF